MAVRERQRRQAIAQVAMHAQPDAFAPQTLSHNYDI
jgi:hypothetical protein